MCSRRQSNKTETVQRQSLPDLFPALRVAIDADRDIGRLFPGLDCGAFFYRT